MRTYNFHVNFEDVQYEGRSDGDLMRISRVFGLEKETKETFVIPLRHWPALRKHLDGLANDITLPNSSSTGGSGP